MKMNKSDAFCPVFVICFRPYPACGRYLSDPVVYRGENIKTICGVFAKIAFIREIFPLLVEL
jgi:hypothetical protein